MFGSVFLMLLFVVLVCSFLIVLCKFKKPVLLKKYQTEDHTTDEQKDITVVICNYARPGNIKKIIKKISKNPYIGEIIVTHGKPKTYREFQGAKNIQNYEINSKYGCAQRWFAALESSNDKILILDDDFIPYDSLILKMRNLSNKDPDQIYGVFKRICSQKGYTYKCSLENYNIVLPGLSMTSKTVVKTFIEDFPKYSETLEKTKGNGEDILFNRSFIDNYGKKPYYIKDAKYRELPNQAESYGSRPDHKSLRNKICKEYFSLKAGILAKKKRATGINLKEKQLLDHLSRHSIDKNNVCIVGGYLLETLGIRHSPDIDFIATTKEGNNVTPPSNNEQIDKKTNWHPTLSDKDIITEVKHHTILPSGLKICTIERVKEHKNAERRQNDLEDLELIDQYHRCEGMSISDKEPNFCGFLWPTVESRWSQILLELNKEVPICTYSIYNFESKEEFEKAVIDIYSTDDIDPRKIIEIKLPSMEQSNNRFLLFTLHVRNPQYRKKKTFGTNISKTIENVKRKIRGRFSAYVKNYVHDNIIHMTDNTEQYNTIKSLLQSRETQITDRFASVPYLLYRQLDQNGNLDRVDIVSRIQTIKKYLADPNYDFSLYRKMQELRVGSACTSDGNRSNKNCLEKFKNLIDSFRTNGLISSYPVALGTQYALIDGSHRIACAYMFNIPFLPVKLSRKSKNLYSYHWFMSRSDRKAKLFFTRRDLIMLLSGVAEVLEFIDKFQTDH